MKTRLEVEGLDELRRRFRRYPHKYNGAVKKTLLASLLKIWEIVGRLGYPPAPSPSSYRRTGTLGRTIGISRMGGKSGRPQIYKVQKMGEAHQAEFGTKLKYAKYVIGEQQAWMHKMRWWTLKGTVIARVKPEIEKLFKAMTEELARWLDGKRA